MLKISFFSFIIYFVTLSFCLSQEEETLPNLENREVNLRNRNIYETNNPLCIYDEISTVQMLEKLKNIDLLTEEITTPNAMNLTDEAVVSHAMNDLFAEVTEDKPGDAYKMKLNQIKTIKVREQDEKFEMGDEFFKTITHETIRECKAHLKTEIDNFKTDPQNEQAILNIETLVRNMHSLGAHLFTILEEDKIITNDDLNLTFYEKPENYVEELYDFYSLATESLCLDDEKIINFNDYLYKKYGNRDEKIDNFDKEIVEQYGKIDEATKEQFYTCIILNFRRQKVLKEILELINEDNVVNDEL